MNNLILYIFTATILFSCSSNNFLEKYQCKVEKVDTYEKGDHETHKTFVYVRIPKELSKEELKNLSNYLRDKYPKNKQLFSYFLLPNMEVSKLAWANSSFNPDLTININGVSKKESNKLKNINAPKESNETLGKWFDNSPYTEASYIIYKIDTIWYLKTLRENGKYENTKELTKSQNDGNSIFNYKNDDGEFILVDKDNKFSIRDASGIIVECQEIKN